MKRAIPNRRAVRPNVGLTAIYQRKLDALIEEMHRSIVYWLNAAYRGNPPEGIAQDESPAMQMRRTMSRLGRRWLKQFDQAAPELAAYFAKSVLNRTDAELQAILRRAGISVPFRMTARQNDAYQAVIGENVGLIKSIASEHLSDVQGLVMRSVQTGRDLGQLNRDLLARYDITKKRAALISRDQNAKATAVLTRTRQLDTGITQARWLHSSAGKVPRPEHVAFSRGQLGGPIYDVAKGAFLEGKWTWPGVEINCRCSSVVILPALVARAA